MNRLRSDLLFTFLISTDILCDQWARGFDFLKCCSNRKTSLLQRAKLRKTHDRCPFSASKSGIRPLPLTWNRRGGAEKLRVEGLLARGFAHSFVVTTHFYRSCARHEPGHFIMKKLFFLTVFFLLSAALSFAQYSLKVGYTQFLSVDPPRGTMRSATWQIDGGGLRLTDRSEVGAIVEVTHWFSETAVVTCNYVYEYVGSYDGKMHAGTGSKSFSIHCVAGTATLSKTSLSMKTGQTATLSCSRSYSHGTVEWTSSDEDVVTVDSRGRVKAVGSGRAVITCDPIVAPELRCQVEVQRVMPTSVKIDPATLQLGLDRSASLKAVYAPSGATATESWTSSNPNVATVSSYGTVKGISEGTATITLRTDNGLTASAQVRVAKINATSVTITPNPVTLKTGDTKTLKATVAPSDANYTLTWRSLNESVAKVSEKGVVTAMSVGETQVEAIADNGVKATATIHVDYASEDELDVIDPRRGPVSEAFVGEGTESSPYLIQSAADLRLLSDECRKGNPFEGKYFRMTNDIVVNRNVINPATGLPNDDAHFERWIPIGRQFDETKKLAFCGNFDGDGHSIYGIYINRRDTTNLDEQYLGLFGTVQDGFVIRNLALKDSYIKDGAGIVNFVGRGTSNSLNGLIENCHNWAVIMGNKLLVAGLVRWSKHSKLTISKCSNQSRITGKRHTAGIVSSCHKPLKIVDCINNGDIITTGYYAGGIIGDSHGGLIHNSLNRGTIWAEKGTVLVAGICGVSSNGFVESNVNLGKIYALASKDSTKAAIVGYLNSQSDRRVQYNHYLSIYANCAIGSSEKPNEPNTSHSESEMKSQQVLDQLNAHRPKGSSKWVSGPDGYPTLEWTLESDILQGVNEASVTPQVTFKASGRSIQASTRCRMRVCSVDGRTVFMGTAQSVDHLDAGIYVVSADGQTPVKVLVR